MAFLGVCEAALPGTFWCDLLGVVAAPMGFETQDSGPELGGVWTRSALESCFVSRTTCDLDRS